MTKDITVSEFRETKRHTFQKWVIRLAVGLSIFLPIFFAVSALGSRFGLWSWKVGFLKLSLGWGLKLMILTLVVGAITLLLAVLIKPRMRGIIAGLIAVAIPLAALGKAANLEATAESLPYIHDVSTDTQDPPLFTEALISERAKTDGVNPHDYIGKKAKGELVSVLQVEAYPDVRPLVLSGDEGAVFDSALNTAKSFGWAIVTADKDNGIIEATDTTFWFGFKDDVIIRVKPSEGGGSVVDVRSLSRVGGSDIGKNAARIRAFTKKLTEG